MSWGAQNRSEDAKTPGVAGVRSDKPEPVSCPVQPYRNDITTGDYPCVAMKDLLQPRCDVW